VAPLEERTEQLRQEISRAVAQLAGGAADAPVVQYSLLMDLGKLQRGPSECQSGITCPPQRCKVSSSGARCAVKVTKRRYLRAV